MVLFMENRKLNSVFYRCPLCGNGGGGGGGGGGPVAQSCPPFWCSTVCAWWCQAGPVPPPRPLPHPTAPPPRTQTSPCPPAAGGSPVHLPQETPLSTHLAPQIQPLHYYTDHFILNRISGPTNTTILLLYRPFHSEHNIWSHKYNHFVIIQTISLWTQYLAPQIQPLCYYTDHFTLNTISGPANTTTSLLYRPFHSEHNTWPDKYNHFVIIQTISLWTWPWPNKYNHFIIIQTGTILYRLNTMPGQTNTTILLLHTWPYKITISLLHSYRQCNNTESKSGCHWGKNPF